MPDDALGDPQFVVRFTGADGPSPAGFARAGDGRRWTRRSDESDAQFEERVLGAPPATTYYIFFPIGTDLEEHDTDDQDRHSPLRLAYGS